MAGKNAEYQTTYLRAEAVYGDTAATFADGVIVRTVGLTDPASIKRGLIDPGVVKLDANDAGVAPVAGLDEGEIKIVTQMSGATLNVAEVAADGLSTYLAAVVGAKNSEVNDACIADCTTTAIKATGHPYSVGDLTMIAGEVRYTSVKDSADQYTVDMPLAAAPGAATVIHGVEQFDVLGTAIVSCGVGISQVDTEMQYILKGCNPTGLELTAFTPGTIGQLTATLQVGNYTRTSITPATAIAGAAGVVTGRVGPGLQLKNAAGAMINPSAASVTCQFGVSREWQADVKGTMGKSGCITGPAEATIECVLYQDTTLSVIEALIGIATTINVQVGNVRGSVWGIYYPEAFLSGAPQPEKIGIAQGVKCTFKASRGILYRA